MPLTRVPLTGNEALAMANVSLERTWRLERDPVNLTQYNVSELNVLGLPSLMYWVRLTTTIGGVVFNPLFSVTNTTTGGITDPNWKSFANGFVLVPGNVTVFTIRASVAVAGIQFSLPPGAGNVNIDTVITAAG